MFDCINPNHPLFIKDSSHRELFAYHDGVIFLIEEAKRDSVFQKYFQLACKTLGKTPRLEEKTLLQLKNEFYSDDMSLLDDSSIEDSSKMQEEVVNIISHAAKSGASDVHILTSSQARVTIIFNRIDGDMVRVRELNLEKGKALQGTLYTTMCSEGEPYLIEKKPQDGRIGAEFVAECGLSGCRVSTRPTDDGLYMVLRLLSKQENKNICLTDAGYSMQQETDLWSIADRPFGLMLMSGATGSGKSTTISNMLNAQYRKYEGKKNIITIEDPPEYKIEGARQTQIICDKNDDDAISREWAKSISSVMRLDPDIIFIGEVRDSSSAMGAIRAAITGHFVYTTLHVNDAFGCIQRLADIGIDVAFLYDPKVLTGLVNQSLTKRLCDNCKLPFLGNEARVSEDVVRRVKRYANPESVCIIGNGCAECNNRGVVGRTAVAEVVKTNSALLEVYRQSGKLAAMKYWVEHMNGITKCQSLIDKINKGIVDPSIGETDVCLLDEDEVTLGAIHQAERVAKVKQISSGGAS
ncbi:MULTISPECIES: GspE/PulE family protein [Aeromonas]|nr:MULTISPECIES: ATPase, T2SS/T4P/T4SS family [Aeromonas]